MLQILGGKKIRFFRHIFVQHFETGLCNEDLVCILYGRNLRLKITLDQFNILEGVERFCLVGMYIGPCCY